MPRNPKSIEAHRITGTKPDAGTRVAGRRVRSATSKATEPVVLGGRSIAVPTHLEPDVLAVFTQIVQVCGAVLAASDVSMVEAAAAMIVRARDAGRDIYRRGHLIEIQKTSRDGASYTTEEVNPSIRIERDSWAQFRLLAEQIGIGPSARARLAAFGVKGESPDEKIPGLAEVRSLTSARKARTG